MPKICAGVVRGCVVLSFALAAMSARSDGGSPAARYPWDKGVINCTLENNARSKLCRATNWPDFVETSTRLNSLAQSGRFDLLEAALADVAASDSLFPDLTSSADSVHWTLRHVAFHSQGSAKGSVLEKWRSAFPDSSFVALADALVLYDAAWRIHGEEDWPSVPPEARELFDLKLGEADSKLLTASSAVKGTPSWHLLRLMIASSRRGGDMQEVFQDAVGRWPRHAAFYFVVVDKLTPRWGGNWSMVDAFIDASTRATSSTDGMSMYARLYDRLRYQVIEHRTEMDWQRMKQGFIDWLARDQSMGIRVLYASYACNARDKAGFADALGRIPKPEMTSREWLPGHSYQACARWAGT